MALKEASFFQEVGSGFHQNFDRQQDPEDSFSEDSKPFVDFTE